MPMAHFLLCLLVYSLYLGYLFYLRYSSTDIRIKASTWFTHVTYLTQQ